MSVTFEEIFREQEEVAGWIQRFWNNICKLGKEKITRSVLEQRKILLDRYWDFFLKGHKQLMRYKEAAASAYVKQDAFSTIEEAYLTTAAKIADHLVDQEKGEGGPPSAEPQLPKIPLPTFSGDPLEWERFRDLFTSLVANVAHLSDAKKLTYLTSSLTGEAAEVIQNTPLTEAGYRGAWQDLEMRYGNIRLLSFAHHGALLSCPAAQNQSAAELKRLLDTFRQTIRSYAALKKPVASWDEWFVYLLSQKLDRTTLLAWETSLVNSKEVPLFQQLTAFLENRIQALNATSITDAALRPPKKDTSTRSKRDSNVRKSSSAVFATSAKTTQRRRCPSCGGGHNLGYCPKFKQLAPQRRKERAEQLRACFNCLNTSHLLSKCPSTHTCLVCSKHHHTLLHDAMESRPTPEGPISANPSEADSGALATSLTLSAEPRVPALLATARVLLEAPSGERLPVRALLDTGSDTTLVTSWVAQALRLPRRAVRVAISGVQENSTGLSNSEVRLVVRSRVQSSFCLPVRALVLRRLTSLLPSQRIESTTWPHLQGLQLADPDYGEPTRVDLILGADVCGGLFQEGTRAGPKGTPIGKLTPFGWVLMGPVVGSPADCDTAVRSFHCQSEESTHQLLQRLWELEELPTQQQLSPEEERCEEQFSKTHTRDSSGRYTVRLPFKLDPGSTLKSSRGTALKLLLSCERRLAANASLGDKYSQFLSEYLSLQHMEGVPSDAQQDNAYYLPHHAVVKRHDPSAKLRVVFNASFLTPSGYSLNDCLSAGPKLQSDLWLILTRWRLFRVVFTSDIVKMFRQIRIHPADADWQRILWRPRPDETVRDYRLTTVTYGTACAPFLALRVLAQLAEDEAHRFPQGAKALRHHSYVDDILAGADDMEGALTVKRQVVSILKAGAFDLSKWASNVPELQETEASEFRLFQDPTGISTLGVLWNPSSDTFSLRVLPPVQGPFRCTKRRILSEVASLFDPLGWVAPVLVFAKVLLQDLWILGVGWDEDLSDKIQERWWNFRQSLTQLDHLEVPRWTKFSGRAQKTELHGFCDASQRAYAAAVYLRVSENGVTTITLLAARTKVAPVKTVTITRLELCGAVLLAKLLTRIRDGLNLSATVTAWTDSSVALHWIRGHASSWKPFVAHRVADIQSQVPPQAWRHVGSSSNPADLPSRGITPAELLQSDLWWTGPSWLRNPPDTWPISFPEENGDAELERGKVHVHLVAKEEDKELLSRFSTLTRLLSVVAHCFRFARLTRKLPCEGGFIRAKERAAALTAVVGLSQRVSFPTDLDDLRRGELKKGSSIGALRPFLDDQGLLRVGGRLSNAQLPYSEKHPLIIAKTCTLAQLLVRDAHLCTLHGGPQLTISLLSRKFWIVQGRSLVRSIIRGCVRCARFNRAPPSQLMGQLPLERISPHRAFTTTGVDYAGPIPLRTTPGRGHKSYKGYIALFICLSTRAIHLEVVSDLTSASFLAAFRRFISRRGRCTTMLSDNGTVFHGAERELRIMFNNASTFYKEAASSLALEGTEWKFIPPHAPHFGGLWEAGVKSVKHHLRRVIGDTKLTFEEMSTLLCQIEACVNSRPLHALSDDPSDLSALTPAHFLIGEPTCALPEPEPEINNQSLTTRWRQLSLMRSHFWHRWRREYLQQLQQLPKWRQQRRHLEIGNLVLLRDDLQPPARWPMGRIEALHPGKDGQVRVVTVRTASGTYTRPIVKLCPLPVATAGAT